MTSSYQLSPEDHQRIYQELLYREIECSTNPVEHPSIVILGGQPGCGKSGMIELSEEEYPNRNVVIINGDDYRSAHPKSDEILRLHEIDYAKLTDSDGREWTKNLFSHAIETRRNIIFESTMRNDEPICSTIKYLIDREYQVKIRVMAVSEKESLLGIYQRFEAQKEFKGFGRMTPIESHNAAYTGILQTISRIESEKLFHSLQVYNRNHDLIYSNQIREHQYTRSPQVVQAMIQERKKPWSPEKWMEHRNGWKQVIQQMEKRKATPSKIIEVKNIVRSVPKKN